MEKIYREIIDYVCSQKQRLNDLSGRIADVGVKKQYLTEEDVRIERELKEIILRNDPKHFVYAEEENDTLPQGDDIWVIDPISGTKQFIAGNPNYAVVLSHLHFNRPVFSLVYHPVKDNIFFAVRNGGVFLNNERIIVRDNVDKDKVRVLFKPSIYWKDQDEIEKIMNILKKNFMVERLEGSMALGYCALAKGEYDGMVTLTKDIFPEMAGSLIVEEAGGSFTNFKGEKINFEDRKFILGNSKTHKKLLELLS